MSAERTRSLEVAAQEALTALRRARRRAERVALATKTHLVDAIDGKPVLVPPRPLAELDEEEKKEFLIPAMRKK